MSPRVTRPPLSVADPHLAAEWHPIRNGDLAPEQVTAGSQRVVWWQCARDPEHEWQQKVIHRTGRGARCPHCVHPREPKPGLLAARPDLAAEWHRERNGELTPDTLSAGSNRLVWWRCARDGRHEWPARVQARVRNGTGCPYCAGMRASPERSLPATHPELAREWHEDRNALGAAEVTAGSARTAWWRCARDARHEWQAPVHARARGRGRCPWCSGRFSPPERSLATSHPELAAQWDAERNRGLRPDGVGADSERRVWWRCERDPDHLWRAEIVRRAGPEDPGCPHCAHRTAPVKLLAALRPALAHEWHEERNVGLGLDVLRPGARQQVWWRCDRGHEWRAAVSERARGAGCPVCTA